MDEDVVGQLGGFALGEVLKDLDIDSSYISGGLSSLGLPSASSAHLSKDSIYKGKFVDEDGEDEDAREDWEAEVDQELYDEKWAKGAAKAKASNSKGLMRGEEEDFDEDDEEEEGGGEARVQVKEEPQDDGRGLFGSDYDEDRGEAEQADVIPPPPPAKRANVKDLFPTFEPGKVLDFTDLFVARPRKKARREYQAVQRS